MAALNTVPLQSPGSLGLNTEDGDSVLDHRFSTVAFNCVLSRNGRLESRKGWSKINSTAATGAPTLDVVHSYITDSGTEILVSAGGSKLWTGDTTLTDSTGTVSVTADYWQFQNTQGKVIGAQSLHEPIWWDGSGTFEYLVDQNPAWLATTAKSLEDLNVPTTRNGYYYECTTAGTTGGSEPTWSTTIGGTTVDGSVTWTTREIPKSNVCLTAFGRNWLASADQSTVHYSDLLIPHAFSGGSSGSIDLNTVWTSSNDTIVALAVHNNNLVIFCTNSVVIYSGADNIGNLALVEVVDNIGCIARDSVQAVGDDLLYLSGEGVRTLSRTVLQDNMPLGTLSSNVRTEIIGTSQQQTAKEAIQSAYNETEGLYLLGFPLVGQVYAFDMRNFAQGQVVKPFIWDSIDPSGMTARLNGDLIFGFAGGFLGKYNTYLDNTSTYIMKYRSGWLDAGTNGMEMIWKKMRVYLYTEATITSTGSWGFDFETAERTDVKVSTATGLSEYNTAEYNIAEYGSGVTATELSFPIAGTGELVRIGYQVTVNSNKVGLNKITLQAKRGKVN